MTLNKGWRGRYLQNLCPVALSRFWLGQGGDSKESQGEGREPRRCGAETDVHEGSLQFTIIDDRHVHWQVRIHVICRRDTWWNTFVDIWVESGGYALVVWYDGTEQSVPIQGKAGRTLS